MKYSQEGRTLSRIDGVPEMNVSRGERSKEVWIYNEETPYMSEIADIAHLIAAAPDLLEKAKEMHSVASLHALECLGNSHAARFMEAINDLEAAISKAEGKP